MHLSNGLIERIQHCSACEPARQMKARGSATSKCFLNVFPLQLYSQQAKWKRVICGNSERVSCIPTITLGVPHASVQNLPRNRSADFMCYYIYKFTWNDVPECPSEMSPIPLGATGLLVIFTLRWGLSNTSLTYISPKNLLTSIKMRELHSELLFLNKVLLLYTPPRR